MTTIITRLYGDKRKASRVVSALKSENYLDRDIDVITGKDDPDDPEHAALRAEMKKAGVYANAAATYAEKVAEGNALLVLRAPFGRAKGALPIIDAHNSIDAGVKYTEVYAGARESVKVKRDQYLPILLNDQTMMSGDVLPGLVKTSTPFSSAFGIPVLMESKGKAKLLTDNPTPFSSLFGMTLLTRGGPSAKLMTDNPTPFSSLFGLPLLTGRRS